MKLHDYQDATADALYENDAICAVLPMGAGKTISTLTTLKDLLAADLIDTAIIWAPKRVAQMVWRQEAEKWGLDLDIQVVEGPPARRQKILDSDPAIIVINYELAQWLESTGWRAHPGTAVVYDEISRLKSATGRRRKSVMKIARDAAFRYGLTGTPDGNKMLGLWGIADALVPGVWGTFYAWRARYFRALDRDGHQWEILPGCDEIVQEEFARLCFKLSEDRIPNRSDPHMLVDTVALPRPAHTLYKEVENELFAELEDGADIFADSAAAKAMKCRQLASGTVYDDTGDAHIIHRAKLEALQDIVEDSGENVLVLYQFLPELEMMREVWPELAVLGGETKDAPAVIDAWNRGEIPVLAGHPASMGHGLNLQQGGRRIVWFSLTWSMEEYEQANARLARQGQTQHVFIHHLLAQNTIDRAVYRALRSKQQIQGVLLGQIQEIA